MTTPRKNDSSNPAGLVIGAGPAGLALAFELKRRGISSLLIEKGLSAGHSWAKMPAGLKLVSPWKANWLPGTDRNRFPRNRALTRAEFGAVLQDYTRQHQLPVVTGATVREVSTNGSGFEIRTDAGDFHALLLVNATGYFSCPFVPEYPGAQESGLLQFHLANYHDADTIRRATSGSPGPVLILGRSLSAGQVMVELAEAGLDVALSSRGPVQFGAGPVGWWVFFRIHPAIERVKLWLQGAAARAPALRMPGGRARQLLTSGRVPTFPDIARFERRSVAFTDGRKMKPSAILYATGFRPALAHLSTLGLDVDGSTGCPQLNRFESANVPGLFFLGVDHLRNFRSRFIRGIREDAPLLADELALRWRTAKAQSATCEPKHRGSNQDSLKPCAAAGCARFASPPA